MSHLSLAILFCSLLLSCSLPSIYGQGLATPPEWQNTQSNLSRSERQDLAGQAAQTLLGQSSESDLPNENSFISNLANLALALASYDLLNGNSTAAESRVGDVLSDHDKGLVFNIDFAYFGLAELGAYLAYNDSARRESAIKNWGIIYDNSFISAAVAQGGIFPRNLTTTPTCGSTLGGLVFQHNDDTNQEIWTRAISPWIMLSSQLAEATHNSTYLQAAELSIQFMQNHLLNLTVEDATIVAHTFNASTCEPSFEASTSLDLAPLIEGLSIVANVTQDQNYTQLLTELIPRAVLAWTDTQGVMNENVGNLGKGYMVRSLLQARRRNPSNTAMVNLIDDFITVQFNAVSNNASLSGGNYNASWLGYNGPSSTYNLLGSIDALNVLNTASAIVPPDQPHTTRSSTNIRVIVGAIVGSVAAVVACGLAVLVYLRRKRARELLMHEDKIELSTSARVRGAPEPYVLTAPQHPRRPITSKAGSYSRVADSSHGTLDGGPGTVDTMTASTPVEPTVVFHHAPDIVSGLARRLDNLIDALAIRGEVEGSPPDYEPGTARLREARP